MSTDTVNQDHSDESRKTPAIDLDRHSTRYRTEFESISDDLHAKCPVAWNSQHGGHWYASGNREVFDLARRADLLSNDNDLNFERKGYDGIQVPPIPREYRKTTSGFLEMDPPDQRDYRSLLNPYLSPAAVARFQPVADEVTRACLDEKIESGRIDFCEDLANIVPAVLTMALLGLPLEEWVHYNEPTHAIVYTPQSSPDFPRVRQMHDDMSDRLRANLGRVRDDPRPGLINALVGARIGDREPDDEELLGVLILLIGGGFDTTTALTAHSLEWLSEHPGDRDRLNREWDTLRDSATEEFLRFYTPAQGDGRTVAKSCVVGDVEFREGDRLWLSWAMANRDEQIFDEPHTIHLDRGGNRHSGFGLGIHRCIGSNLARMMFKTMLRAVLDRLPDYVCDPGGTEHYDTVGIINGIKTLPATFTPGKRLGPGLTETLATMATMVAEQGLAESVVSTGRRPESVEG